MRTDSLGRKPRSPDAGAAVTLDAFAAATLRADGVTIAQLTRLDRIEVQTRNSVYTIDILDPIHGRALVRGGAFFPVPREAVINGASLGRSMLKCGVVLVGFQFELLSGSERIVTSGVREIRVCQQAGAGRPF